MLPSGTRGLRDSFAEPVPGTVLSEKQNLRECRGIGLRTGPRPYAVWVRGRSLRGAAASVWRDRPSGRGAGSGWGRGRTDWNPLSSLTSCKPSDMGDQLEKLTLVPQSCARLAQDSDPQGRRPRDCRSGSEARPAVGRCVPPPHLAPHADLRSARAVAAALPARWPAPTQNRPRRNSGCRDCSLAEPVQEAAATVHLGSVWRPAYLSQPDKDRSGTVAQRDGTQLPPA